MLWHLLVAAMVKLKKVCVFFCYFKIEYLTLLQNSILYMKNTAHIRNNKLTVLIPFMNEGEEVAATVRDVRRTAGMGVDVIVVNDCSTDGYDYKKDLEQYKITYIENNY